MNVNVLSNGEILRIFLEPLPLGFHVQSASRSVGSSFIIKSYASLNGDEPLEWRLDVMSAEWTLVSGEKISRHTDQSIDIESALYDINGKTIIDFGISTDGSLLMIFSNNCRLDVSPSQCDLNQNWMISYRNRWLVTSRFPDHIELETL